MKTNSRAIRRHHQARLKKARAVHDRMDHIGSEHYPRALGKYVQTPARCSCWMCGNPRKYFHERTKAEQCFDDIEKSFE